MSPEHLEHLRMVQAAIARMAQNSFLLKGWSVTLVTGTLALTVSEKQHGLIFLGVVPVIAFWILDGFYLLQERRFRAIQERIVADASAGRPATFLMDTRAFRDQTDGWPSTLLSRTVVWLHVPLLVVVVAVALAANASTIRSAVSCLGPALQMR